MAALPKAETKQQLADWWDSFDSRYMRPYFSRPEGDSPSATQGARYNTFYLQDPNVCMWLSSSEIDRFQRHLESHDLVLVFQY